MSVSIQDYPSVYEYITANSQGIYIVPCVIKGKEYVKLEINGVVVDRLLFDVVNNTLVLYFKPLDGMVMRVKVASSPKGILQLEYNTSQEAVLNAMVKMNYLLNKIDVIKNVRNNLTHINNVNSNLAYISIVASNSESVKQIALNNDMFLSTDIKNHGTIINRDSIGSHTINSITGLMDVINSIQSAGVFPTSVSKTKTETSYVLARDTNGLYSLDVKALIHSKYEGNANLNPFYTSGLITTDVYNTIPNRSRVRTATKRGNVRNIISGKGYKYRIGNTTEFLISGISTNFSLVSTIPNVYFQLYFKDTTYYTGSPTIVAKNRLKLYFVRDAQQFIDVYLIKDIAKGYIKPIKTIALTAPVDTTYNRAFYIEIDDNDNITTNIWEYFRSYNVTAYINVVTGKIIRSSTEKSDGTYNYTYSYYSVAHSFFMFNFKKYMCNNGGGGGFFYTDIIAYLKDSTEANYITHAIYTAGFFNTYSPLEYAINYVYDIKGNTKEMLIGATKSGEGQKLYYYNTINGSVKQLNISINSTPFFLPRNKYGEKLMAYIENINDRGYTVVVYSIDEGKILQYISFSGSDSYTMYVDMDLDNTYPDDLGMLREYYI